MVDACLVSQRSETWRVCVRNPEALRPYIWVAQELADDAKRRPSPANTSRRQVPLLVRLVRLPAFHLAPFYYSPSLGRPELINRRIKCYVADIDQAKYLRLD